eukprot:12364045-Alexandrium_andersonii.AAC.1
MCNERFLLRACVRACVPACLLQRAEGDESAGSSKNKRKSGTLCAVTPPTVFNIGVSDADEHDGCNIC